MTAPERLADGRERLVMSGEARESRSANTPEQAARDLLERMGLENAQELTAGDVVELANLIARYREALTALRSGGDAPASPQPEHLRLGPRPPTHEEVAERTEKFVQQIMQALVQRQSEKVMTVRAKFTVHEKTTRLPWDQAKREAGAELATVKMNPVTSGSEENKTFYEATPSGNIDLGTLNPEAAAFFKLGKSYYVTFEEAE